MDGGGGSPQPEAAADAPLLFDIDGMAPNACTRTATLSVVSGGAPQPFDVVIVADNADGLGFSQSDLAKGLQNFVSAVSGRAVRFFLLSTTQYGASSQAAISRFDGSPLVSWSSSVSGAPDANPVTQYSQTCTDPDGKPIACPTFPQGNPYELHGTWSFTMPAPIGAITPSMTPAQLAAQQQAVSSAILGLGGGGSEEEQPICTLSRYIAQPASALPKHAAFVVLSDEDDTTPARDCLAAYDYTAKPLSTEQSEESCTSNCDLWDYQEIAPSAATSLSYDCVPVDDKGQQYPAKAEPHTLSQDSLPSCPATSATSCSSSQLASAANDCGTGYVVQGCTAACVTAEGRYCGLERTTDAVDLCTQSFQENGTTYANLAAYCAQLNPGFTFGGCARYGFDYVDASTSNGYSTSEQKTQVVDGVGNTADMISSFKTRAAAAFGGSGYQVETIQLDPSFSCALGPGQGYGPTLRTLASSGADVFSICGSYADALKRVQSFADALQSAYALTLGAAETIASVVATGGSGVTRLLPAGAYTYDAAAATLTFVAGTLLPGDTSVAVTIATATCGTDSGVTAR
jgi:hypothetical protein